MDFNNIPIMAALRQRMRWLNQNQTVLSENVANADTPGYKAKELSKQDFSGLVDNLSGSSSKGSVSHVALRVTEPGHMSLNGGMAGDSHVIQSKIEDESPTGNTVVLEEQMMKVADNQMKYGVAVNLYKKNMGLLKIALGRGG
ncbi:flagellar basal body rod protein FlgB [Kordiimonas marina]|uniref:flagellar basal body rod protein FlgB n=1 Tax=Kordiimonas marina TaxID=2872312 RepID=UPI001FF2FFD1|nr:flagellar basal body rod protein FlgB [Kordiimonas marina]MCJ9429026.1 flagellar basal body rod protein FlgB [Kordiimonas marina]